MQDFFICDFNLPITLSVAGKDVLYFITFLDFLSAIIICKDFIGGGGGFATVDTQGNCFIFLSWSFIWLGSRYANEGQEEMGGNCCSNCILIAYLFILLHYAVLKVLQVYSCFGPVRSKERQKKCIRLFFQRHKTFYRSFWELWIFF